MTQREKLLRLVAVLGHVRVRADGSRSIVRPYKRSSRLRRVVQERVEASRGKNV